MIYWYFLEKLHISFDICEELRRLGYKKAMQRCPGFTFVFQAGVVPLLSGTVNAPLKAVRVIRGM
jgi:hypothetical protein